MDVPAALVLQLKQEIESQTQALAAGRAASIEEYRRMCGVIHGLNLAIQTTQALQQEKDEHE